MADPLDTESYDLEQSEFSFDNDKQDLFSISDSYESVLESPINQTLGSFQREFIKNERLAFERFLQLNRDLVRFEKMINQNPIYQESDLARLAGEVLLRYKEFCTMLRQNVLLSKEKVEEMKKMIDTYYVKISTHEEYQEAVSDTLDELEKDFDYLEIRGKNEKGLLIVEIPAEVAKRRNLIQGKRIAMREIKQGGIKQFVEENEVSK